MINTEINQEVKTEVVMDQIIELTEQPVLMNWSNMTWCRLCSNNNNGICMMSQNMDLVPLVSSLSKDQYECPKQSLPF